MSKRYKEHVELINKQFKEMAGIYRNAIKQLDISESEFWIWYSLVSMGGDCTQQDICSIWSLPKQTVNTIITHMKQKKLAYLETIPGTRNHKVVRLTEEGRKYGEKIIQPISRIEERIFGKISPDEVSIAINIFRKYIEVMRGEFLAET